MSTGPVEAPETGETDGLEAAPVSEHALLRSVIESPRDVVIFALDRSYRYLAFNEAHRRTIKRIWGRDVEVGGNMLDLIGREDDRARAKANFDRALTGEHFTLSEAYGDALLSRRFYENVYDPIFSEDGEVVGLTVFLIDTTEETLARLELEDYKSGLEQLVAERTAALVRTEARYRTLVTNAPLAVVVYRGDEVLYANPAAVALAGRGERDRVLGIPVRELLGDAPIAGSLAAPVEAMLRHSDGSVVEVEWRSIPVDFGGGSAVMSLGVDVTDRRKAEAERRRFEERTLQAQKLESLGLLAGGVAHDFNNLLVGVLGNAELALRDPIAIGALRTQIERIKTAAIRASELTAQLLAYSGKGPLVVHPFDLNGLAEELGELLAMAIPHGASLTTDLAPSLPQIQGDAVQVRQVVMNLLTNAADAVGSSRGARNIRVTTSVVDFNAHDLAAFLGAETLAVGKYVCLEVTDTGVGMDEATLAHLFDPFFTTKEKGHGLGLAAVLGIVRAHGGAVCVTSTPGRGTSFRVLFPPACPPPASSAAIPESDGALLAARGAVLIADDEPRVRQVLVLMLQDLGFRTLEAATTAACLDVFREHAAEISLLLVDLVMPGGGGQEIVRTLRAEGVRVPVVVSSGYSEDAIGPELRADPNLLFLEKPFDMDTLTRTVRRALDTQPPSSWRQDEGADGAARAQARRERQGGT